MDDGRIEAYWSSFLGTLPADSPVRDEQYVAEAMIEVTERSAECFGAMGVMRDMPMQQYVGDALVFKHSGPGHSASKLLIAEAVAGFERTR